MLRGEALAWIFSLAMYETVLMFEQDVLSKSRQELSLGMHIGFRHSFTLLTTIFTEYSQKLKAMTVPPPSPKYCNGLHCNRKPICFTDFRPHYPTNLTLTELIVGTTAWIYDPGII
jgi:hypothetical protein